jgi:AAA+ ATPase superfamily predicted ATPase
LFLILCGSYVGFMEREVLGRASPLFGRRTGQILLRPFRFAEAGGFHPSYSETERARAYFVCGGVPLYLRAFDATRSVEQNVVAAVLDEYGPLFREPDFLIREELREVETYHAVLNVIAAGKTAVGEIASAAGVGERALHYYLQQLMELGYVRRRHPLTGSTPNRRHVRYDLDDPLLRFWFRFVFPNTSYLAAAGPERAFKDLIRPGLDAYFGSCFERLCRETLPDVYRAEGVTAAFEVGEYWDRSTQIDVVGLRDDGVTDIGECKWGTLRSPNALSAEIEAKVPAYPNPRNATIVRRAFVRAAPATIRSSAKSRAGTDVRWHTLEELARGGT